MVVWQENVCRHILATCNVINVINVNNVINVINANNANNVNNVTNVNEVKRSLQSILQTIKKLQKLQFCNYSYSWRYTRIEVGDPPPPLPYLETAILLIPFQKLKFCKAKFYHYKKKIRWEFWNYFKTPPLSQNVIKPIPNPGWLTLNMGRKLSMVLSLRWF